MEVNRASRFTLPLMTTHGDIFEEVCLNICSLNPVNTSHSFRANRSVSEIFQYLRGSLFDFRAYIAVSLAQPRDNI